jgi:hypothetical protein
MQPCTFLSESLHLTHPLLATRDAGAIQTPNLGPNCRDLIPNRFGDLKSVKVQQGFRR